MPTMTYSRTSKTVMTIEARMAITEERIAKMMEDIEVLRKENAELQQKVIMTDDGSHHACNDHEYHQSQSNTRVNREWVENKEM